MILGLDKRGFFFVTIFNFKLLICRRRLSPSCLTNKTIVQATDRPSSRTVFSFKDHDVLNKLTF